MRCIITPQFPSCWSRWWDQCQSRNESGIIFRDASVRNTVGALRAGEDEESVLRSDSFTSNQCFPFFPIRYHFCFLSFFISVTYSFTVLPLTSLPGFILPLVSFLPFFLFLFISSYFPLQFPFLFSLISVSLYSASFVYFCSFSLYFPFPYNLSHFLFISLFSFFLPDFLLSSLVSFLFSYFSYFHLLFLF